MPWPGSGHHCRLDPCLTLAPSKVATRMQPGPGAQVLAAASCAALGELLSLLGPQPPPYSGDAHRESNQFIQRSRLHTQALLLARALQTMVYWFTIMTKIKRKSVIKNLLPTLAGQVAWLLRPFWIGPYPLLPGGWVVPSPSCWATSPSSPASGTGDHTEKMESRLHLDWEPLEATTGFILPQCRAQACTLELGWIHSHNQFFLALTSEYLNAWSG